MECYREAILSDDAGTVTNAFFLAIAQRDFFLNEEKLQYIESKFNDERVSGWVFAYRVYGSPTKTRIDFLRLNISNGNPRIREQVCDIVGDESIAELRSELKQLFSDPVDYVSEAARYNHDEMF